MTTVSQRSRTSRKSSHSIYLSVRKHYPALLSGLEREGIVFDTSDVGNTVSIRGCHITIWRSLDFPRVVGALLESGANVVIYAQQSQIVGVKGT